MKNGSNIKVIMGALVSLIFIASIIFVYQKSNIFVDVKKEGGAVPENVAVKSAKTDDNKTDNFPSVNIVVVDDINSVPRGNDTNKQSNNTEVAKWIENLIGYKKIEARTLNVPADFGKIQEAINNANRGDVIKVLGGEYKENILMKNGVGLEGEGAEKTILDGNNLGNVVAFKSVRDPKTYLSGFTIKNAGKSLSGISIENSSPWIHDNIVDENEFGVYIKGESHPVIQKNIVKNSSKGIQVYNFIEEKQDQSAVVPGAGEEARNEEAIQNAVQNTGQAIIAEDSKTRPIIIDNLIIDNKIGIDLYNSYAYIEHNDISYNNHYKIYLGATYGINASSSSSDIISNIITDNGICELCAGINADENSKKILISYNDIWNNKSDFLCFGECILEDNNISEDPLYIDTMTGDYKLQSESLLIGKSKDGADVGIRW